MGLGWAICPVCGKKIIGNYDPRTGINGAMHKLKTHCLYKHGLIVSYSGEIIRKATIKDFYRLEEPFDVYDDEKVQWFTVSRATCFCGKEFRVEIPRSENSKEIAKEKVQKLVEQHIKTQHTNIMSIINF